MLFEPPVCANDAETGVGERACVWSIHFGSSSVTSRHLELILPLQARSSCSLEWPHVLKLFLRRLQPLAQALDVFIVWLVLLLMHLQQRPQDFDAVLFVRHTLSVFKLAYERTVSGWVDRFTGFYVCVWLNVVVRVSVD
jgi:hypothetical protein